MNENLVNKVLCGDCVTELDKIEDNSVDLVVTSPPYNLRIEYDICDDNKSQDEYYRWCAVWLGKIYRKLKFDGRFCLLHYLSCGNSYGRYAPLMDLNSICQNIGFKHHGLAIWWDEQLSKRSAWGSWLSSSSPYINSPFEGILVLYKDRWKRDNAGKTEISKEDFMMCCSGLWKVGTERDRTHPAPFPKRLSDLCVLMFSYEGDLVLDPFAGSGTTLVSAKSLKRDFIGIELSKKYCKMSEKRLMEYSNVFDF